MNPIRQISFYFFIGIIFGCSAAKRNPEMFITNDCPTSFHTISFSNLADSISVYNNKYVEVTGFYTWEIEGTAISESKRKTKPKIWVAFDEDISRKSGDTTVNLLSSRSEFDRIVEKTITIRGVVDQNDHGHLGQYIATIKKVCYLKISD